jgi:hypothetical protein
LNRKVVEREIAEIIYRERPWPQIWVRYIDKGNVLSVLLFHPQEELFAWTNYELAEELSVYGFAMQDQGEESVDVCFLVKKGGEFWFEVLTYSSGVPDFSKNADYLTSVISRDFGTSAVKEVDGLEFFEGEEVYVCLDGNPFVKPLTVRDGTVELFKEAFKVFVGKAVERYHVTLPIDRAQRPYFFIFKKSVAKLFMRFRQGLGFLKITPIVNGVEEPQNMAQIDMGLSYRSNFSVVAKIRGTASEHLQLKISGGKPSMLQELVVMNTEVSYGDSATSRR